MSRNLMHIILSVSLVIMLPWATVVTIGNIQNTPPEDVMSVTQTTQTTAGQLMISVMKDSGEIEAIKLEEYILGVVLKEMPADFEIEALKAQAVVARTYAMRREEMGGKHIGAPVCTSAACCQGYCSPDTYGGDAQNVEKVRQAVAQTDGLVLHYDGKLIDATYYSCSGGRTEDALAVWGTDIPYLQSVPSPGEEKATHYTDTVTYSVEAFQSMLGRTLDGRPEAWIGEVTYTDGGGVDTIMLCGHKYTGTELRQKLGLRSTAFVISAIGDTVTITTKGFGHRVGMSQYGADAMALQGSGFAEILSYYYPGTALVSLSEQH